MLPPTSWNHRPVGKRMSGGGLSAGARTSTSSAGSAFSLEVILEGGDGERVESRLSSSSSTSRMVWPGGRRSSLGSSTHCAGERDSSGSSTFDQQMGMGSRYCHVTPTKRPSADEIGILKPDVDCFDIEYSGAWDVEEWRWVVKFDNTGERVGVGSGLGMKFNEVVASAAQWRA